MTKDFGMIGDDKWTNAIASFHEGQGFMVLMWNIWEAETSKKFVSNFFIFFPPIFMQKVIWLLCVVILISWCSNDEYVQVDIEPSTNTREISCSKNRRDYETYPVWYCDMYYNSPMLDTEMICIKHVWWADKDFINKDFQIKNVVVWEEDLYIWCNTPCEEMKQEVIDIIDWCYEFKTKK